MMMSDNKKKLATIIVGNMKADKPEMPPMKDEVEQDDSIAKESAAQDLLSAIEQKNTKGIVEAITNLMELCEYEEPEQSEMPEQE